MTSIHYHPSDPHLACVEDHGDTSKVTPELREEILARDDLATSKSGFAFGPICVAPLLDVWAGPCHGRTTLDHVKSAPRLGKRAESDPAHLVSLCWHHHLDGWATSHRPELRRYLAAVTA